MKWLNEIKTRFVYIGRMFRLLWEYDKIYLFLSIGCIILDAVKPFITMYLIKFSVDMLMAKSDYFTYLPTVLILLGAGAAVHAAVIYISVPADIRGNSFGNRLFTALFKKTLELDYEMLQDKNSMEKRQMASKVFEQQTFSDLTGNFKALIGNFRSFAYNLIVLCGIVYIVARIEFWILLVVMAIVIINSVMTGKRTQAQRGVSEILSPIYRRLEYFDSVDADTSFGKEIRLYSIQGLLSKKHRETQKEKERLLTQNSKVYRLCALVRHITSLGLDALMYGYLGFKILVQHLITVGDFALYLNAITRFNGAIQEMVASFIAISDNGRYLKDYFDYMELKSRYDTTGRALPQAGSNVFVFENVSFCYPYQAEPTLKNINLTIADRERLSIVGENGAGKTTLIKLLMRLYDPTDGRILLHGTDIREIDYRHYLNLFASVFQDFKHFAFRIADNISSLQDGGELDREKLRDCLIKAGLNEKIESLEKGVETYLYKLYEPDGVELSGGESQKLAIARALYKDAPVVVLDEPTAALDPRAEYEIYLKFFEMVKDKSSVFITHRLSSTRFCDRIVVLKNGSVVETGSHEELLGWKGYSAELFNMQAQFYTKTESA
jgi:ABC-type multidrug transport system fused ATPase/permease subunit